jgi:short-chain Z-isoprenyl diphosphate synthase
VSRSLTDLAYAAYERRLAARLPTDRIPRHVGVILDGNRRWARDAGETADAGHRAGADRIDALLGWCEEFGVEVVTLWLLSTDNLARPDPELAPLLDIIVATTEQLAQPKPGRSPRRINIVGALDLLPPHYAERLRQVGAATADRAGLVVNVAVGYGGRREIADAVRSLLAEHAGRGTSLDELATELTVEHIAEHLYTRGQPDPDLVIRTSGEQRLSGFLLWQSAHSEFYFCEAYWPDFRRVDFLRALRDYAARHRRFGG